MPDGTGVSERPLEHWVVEPRQLGVAARVRELWQYRYLWWYFAADTTTSLYRRSKLGWLWLVLRATAPVGLSAIVFGGILGVPSEGVPYFLFFLSGMTTWVLFERSLIYVTRSLEQHRRLVTKVYFPRMILPMSAIAPGLLFLAVLLVVLIGTVVYFHRTDGVWYVSFSPRLLAAVAAILMCMVFTVAVGLWTSVLQARYRDVRYGLRYSMPFWLYFTPIMYPVSMIPEQWRWVVALNPMWPIVETFRWGTIGTGGPTAVGLGMSVSLIVLTMVSGAWFFSREEAASIDTL